MTKIAFTGAANYNGPSSPRAQLLPFQGYTYGEILEITEGQSKTGNATLDFSIKTSEKDAEGFKLRKVQAVTGEMGGKRAGTQNVEGLFDIYFSTFTAGDVAEKDARDMVQKLNNRELDTEEVIRDLTGQRVYMLVKARQYTNKDGTEVLTSDVEKFISKQEFVKNAAAPGHHWKNPDLAGSDAPAMDAVKAPNGVRTSGRI